VNEGDKIGWGWCRGTYGSFQRSTTDV